MIGRQVYVAIRENELPDSGYIDVCPVCGESTHTIECEHCGADIAEVESEQLQIEVERIINHGVRYSAL